MTKDARISTAMPSHPKTKKLIKRIGGDGAWRWTCLILWAAANRSDGDLSGMTDEDIELAVDWPGEPGELVNALREVGFLDGGEGGYALHDWAQHNPWAAGAEDRSEKSKWAALCKRYGSAGAAERMPDYAPRMPDAPDPHAKRTRPACVEDAPSPLPSPSPIPTPSKERSPSGVSLLPDVDPSIVRDHLAIRKAKKLPLTESAVRGMQREADAVGLTLEAALRVSCENGWAGFKADWYRRLGQGASGVAKPIPTGGGRKYLG